MIKHFISVDIVDHRLVGMPHVLRVTGRRAATPPASRAIGPVRGLAIAAILSSMLWAGLIATAAGSSGDEANEHAGATSCIAASGTTCVTPRG